MGQSINEVSLKKLPPFDIEAEQAILCACLLDNGKIYEVLEHFQPVDFYRPSHRKIYAAMFAVAERRDAVDLLSLKNQLHADGTLEEVGGLAYLIALPDIVPTAANVETHARIVHEKAVKRRLYNVAVETATRILDDRDIAAADVLDAHEQQIMEITESGQRHGAVSVADISQTVFDDIERRAEGGIPAGLRTGLHDLDGILTGIEPTDLVIIAGRPAMGKTSFALNIASHLGETSPGAIFSLEMSKEQLVFRLHCSEGRVDSQAAKAGTLTAEEWDRYTSGVEIVNRKKLYIDDTAGLTPATLRSKARRLKREKGIRWIVVDYLQLMDAGQRTENRNVEVSYISRQAKMLAKDLHVPVFMLSQLSRKCEERTDKRPQLSDLRDSGSIEQDADIVMFLYRPEVYNEAGKEGIAEVIVAKHREGPIGTAETAFVAEFTRFENLARRQHFPNMGVTF